jgi:hypothetical protein
MTIDMAPGTAEDRLAVVSSDVAGLALPLLVPALIVRSFVPGSLP